MNGYSDACLRSGGTASPVEEFDGLYQVDDSELDFNGFYFWLEPFIFRFVFR